MEIDNIKNTINEVLNSDESKSLLKEKIDTLAEKKAQELYESQKKESEEQKKLLFDKEKDELKKVVEERLQSKFKEIHTVLEKYITETVNEFISEHTKDFKAIRNKEKLNCILESLCSILRIAGIQTEEITNGVSYKVNEDVEILKDRVKVLKEQLQEEQERVRKIRNTFKSELSEIELKHKDEIDDVYEKHAIKENSEIEKLKNIIDEINQKNADLEDEIELLKNKNSKLSEENSKVIQLGIISELKRDLSLTEAQKFEKCAMNIPFSTNKKYIEQLKTLKESLQNEENLTEIVKNDDEVPESMKRFI